MVTEDDVRRVESWRLSAPRRTLAAHCWASSRSPWRYTQRRGVSVVEDERNGRPDLPRP